MTMDNRLFDLFAFAVTACIAFTLEWKPNELCWGLWISSLTVGWVVIVFSILRTLLHVAGIVPLSAEDLGSGSLAGYFRRSAAGQPKDSAPDRTAVWPAALVSLGAAGLGLFAWFHFTMFHVIHGLLMSVFIRMEPEHLFGPNGFINADFGEILPYLMANYWAMVLGTLIARRRNIVAGNPGENIKTIYGSVVRIHIFILLSAFLAFLVYFGLEVYNQVLLLILLGLFFYRRSHSRQRKNKEMLP